MDILITGAAGSSLRPVGRSSLQVIRPVLHCEQNKCAISDLSFDTLSTFCDLFGDDVYEEISEATCVAKRNIPAQMSRDIFPNSLCIKKGVFP